ncbi:hypothetical protein O7632_18570 [Solwaraspora sp. WMMD406]|uniref:hypothetical protein n=1 Tax=Solwaraspora sp. WMMD406 TaxID=3016095 RepID=UPI002415B5E8|nr:hypothetical protein [Solwaraspora sp. WMMD406]MDG4766092.1 hypothetical protein [Solwaraspora sp. WMMD406]
MASSALRRLTAGLLPGILLLAPGATPAHGATFPGEVQADSYSTPVGISADGRYALFTSTATNLVDGGRGAWHLYLRDVEQATTELVDVTTAGDVPTAPVTGPAQLSLYGRYAVFGSNADGLVGNDLNGVTDAFLRDLRQGHTELVSVASDGTAANDWSVPAGVSADGRYVIFQSSATNLVSGGTPTGTRHLYLRDRSVGSTSLIGPIPADSLAPGWSPVTSADGDHLGYDLRSAQSGWVSYRHHVPSAAVTAVSTATTGMPADASTHLRSISRNGQFVLMDSAATNLAPDDTNGATDVFVHNTHNGRTSRVSLADGGGEADLGASGGNLSATGRYVAFESSSTNLTVGSVAGPTQVYVRDREAARTYLVSRSTLGGPGTGSSRWAVLSANGHYVTFASDATDLVPGDTNSARDVFVHDLTSGTTTRVSVG